MEGMIQLPDGINLVTFVQRVYEMSQPQGMGIMHFQAGGLPEDDAKRIIEREGPDGRIAASMDYVHGRACKMTVFRENGHLYVRPSWYDHSASQYKKLLSEFGVTLPEAEDQPAGWGTAA